MYSKLIYIIIIILSKTLEGNSQTAYSDSQLWQSCTELDESVGWGAKQFNSYALSRTMKKLGHIFLQNVFGTQCGRKWKRHGLGMERSRTREGTTQIGRMGVRLSKTTIQREWSLRIVFEWHRENNRWGRYEHKQLKQRRRKEWKRSEKGSEQKCEGKVGLLSAWCRAWIKSMLCFWVD